MGSASLTSRRSRLAETVKAACSDNRVELYGSFRTGWFHLVGRMSFSDVDTRATSGTCAGRAEAARRIREVVVAATDVELRVSVRPPETHRETLAPPVSLAVAKVYTLLALASRRDEQYVAYQCAKFLLRARYGRRYDAPLTGLRALDNAGRWAACLKLGLPGHGFPLAELLQLTEPIAPEMAQAFRDVREGRSALSVLREEWPNWEHTVTSARVDWLLGDMRRRTALAFEAEKNSLTGRTVLPPGT